MARVGRRLHFFGLRVPALPPHSDARTTTRRNSSVPEIQESAPPPPSVAAAYCSRTFSRPDREMQSGAVNTTTCLHGFQHARTHTHAFCLICRHVIRRRGSGGRVLQLWRRPHDDDNDDDGNVNDNDNDRDNDDDNDCDNEHQKHGNQTQTTKPTNDGHRRTPRP